MSTVAHQTQSTALAAIAKTKARKDRLDRWRIYAMRLAFFASLIGLWHTLVWLEVWDEMIFPSLPQVTETLWLGISDQSLPAAIAISMQRLLIGYGLALCIGIPLGLLLGRVRWLNETVGMLAMGLQALPSICWLPLAVLWFGLGESAMIFVVAMGALMALTLATRDGVKNMPPLYMRAAHVLGARGWRLYVHVMLPATLPAVLTGAKLGWSFAWRSLMAAELLLVGVGLGSLLERGRELHDMSLVVAVMMVIIFVGLMTDRWLFSRLEQRFVHRRWGTSA